MHKEMLDTIKKYLDEDDIEPFGPNKIQSGYCIKTKTKILFNPKRPIQYDAWKSREDEDSVYCHKCGKESKTSCIEPICEDCR